MDELNQMLESGIARTQLKAAEAKLSKGSKIEEVHQSNISYLSECTYGLVISLFVVFLSLFFFPGINIYIKFGVLLLAFVVLVARIVANIRRKREIQASRERDIENCNN